MLSFLFQPRVRFQKAVPDLQAGPGASPGSLLCLLHLSPAHLGHPCLIRAPSGASQGPPAFTTPLPDPSLCPHGADFGGRGGRAKRRFSPWGPRAGVRTFWFLPAPSGPDSGRTPGCTCTRTSSRALEAAPCPLCPGAAGSPHGSWGGEGAGKGQGDGAQGGRGGRGREERGE